VMGGRAGGLGSGVEPDAGAERSYFTFEVERAAIERYPEGAHTKVRKHGACRRASPLDPRAVGPSKLAAPWRNPSPPLRAIRRRPRRASPPEGRRSIPERLDQRRGPNAIVGGQERNADSPSCCDDEPIERISQRLEQHELE